MRRNALRVLATVLLIGVAARDVLQSEAQNTNASHALLPILEVLAHSGTSGSLEFSGKCSLQTLPELPPVRNAVAPKSSALDTLAEMFAGSRPIRVKRAHNGIIRMKEEGVNSDFLKVKLDHITFESNGANGQTGVYNPNIALDYILARQEVVAFMKSHQTKWPYVGGAVPGNAGRWPSHAPHVAGSLRGVTVEEALDYVVKNFPGLWIYESCPAHANQSRTVYIRFYQLRKLGSEVEVVGQSRSLSEEMDASLQMNPPHPDQAQRP
jgi:hypothetical protein